MQRSRSGGRSPSSRHEDHRFSFGPRRGLPACGRFIHQLDRRSRLLSDQRQRDNRIGLLKQRNTGGQRFSFLSDQTCARCEAYFGARTGGNAAGSLSDEQWPLESVLNSWQPNSVPCGWRYILAVTASCFSALLRRLSALSDVAIRKAAIKRTLLLRQRHIIHHFILKSLTSITAQTNVSLVHSEGCVRWIGVQLEHARRTFGWQAQNGFLPRTFPNP